MGRPPNTWAQNEEKQLEKLKAAYMSAAVALATKLEAANSKGGGFDVAMPPSIQERCREKMFRRQRKVDDMLEQYVAALRKFDVEKDARARLARWETEWDAWADKYEKYETAETRRQTAETALLASAAENRRLSREVRNLRALLAGEAVDAKEKLAADLEWCEAYLRGETLTAEEAVAAVRDKAWDTASAEAEMIAHSQTRQARALMPPPPDRAPVRVVA